MAAIRDQPSPTPKLSLYSLPFKPINHEPPGMLTPPIHALATVPFNWEEVPGKPRQPCASSINDDDLAISSSDSRPNKAARCLELPPRLLSEAAAKVVASNGLPSPTTVLDGPYIGRSRSLSFAKGSLASEKVVFGSTRWWGNPKKNSNNDNKELVGVGFDFCSSNYCDFFEDSGGSGSGDSYDGSGTSTTKVKITRIRRRSSFLSSTSKRSSSFLTSIYEGLKQVVPWKRRHDKMISEIN